MKNDMRSNRRGCRLLALAAAICLGGPSVRADVQLSNPLAIHASTNACQDSRDGQTCDSQGLADPAAPFDAIGSGISGMHGRASSVASITRFLDINNTATEDANAGLFYSASAKARAESVTTAQPSPGESFTPAKGSGSSDTSVNFTVISGTYNLVVNGSVSAVHKFSTDSANVTFSGQPNSGSRIFLNANQGGSEQSISFSGTVGPGSYSASVNVGCVAPKFGDTAGNAQAQISVALTPTTTPIRWVNPAGGS